MTEKRLSLWDSSKKDDYSTNHDRQTLELLAKNNGEHTAKDLDSVLAGISPEQSNFVEYLLLSEKNTVVARYDSSDVLLPGLIEKGLLQLPTGVGTVSVLKLTTTFRIPKAVWKALNERRGALIPEGRPGQAKRLEELTKQFENRIDALVETAVIASNDG
jgi:hypothetical protein